FAPCRGSRRRQRGEGHHRPPFAERCLARARHGAAVLRRRRRVARDRAHAYGAAWLSAPHHPRLSPRARRCAELPRPDGAAIAQIARENLDHLAQALGGGAARRAHSRTHPAPHRCERGGVLGDRPARGPSLQPDGRGAAAHRSAARGLRRGSARQSAFRRGCRGADRLERAALPQGDSRAAAAAAGGVAPRRHCLARPSRLPRRAGLASRALYGGSALIDSVPSMRLLDGEEREAARAIGLALRLAYTLTGGVPGLLDGSALKLGDSKLVLTLLSDNALLAGEAVQRRLDALGKA